MFVLSDGVFVIRGGLCVEDGKLGNRHAFGTQLVHGGVLVRIAQGHATNKQIFFSEIQFGGDDAMVIAPGCLKTGAEGRDFPALP